MPTPTSKEPYEKPTVTIISISELTGDIERLEGELYRRFSCLADRYEDHLDKLQAFEVELRSCSEGLDDLKQRLNRVRLFAAIQEGKI